MYGLICDLKFMVKWYFALRLSLNKTLPNRMLPNLTPYMRKRDTCVPRTRPSSHFSHPKHALRHGCYIETTRWFDNS